MRLERRAICAFNFMGPLNCLPPKLDQFIFPPIMRCTKVPVFLTFNNNWCYRSFTFWPLWWVKTGHFISTCFLRLSQSMLKKKVYLNLDFPAACSLVICIFFLWIVCPSTVSIFLLYFSFSFWFVGIIFITPTLSHYTCCKGFHPVYCIVYFVFYFT